MWWSSPVRAPASAAALLDDAERARCATYRAGADRARFVSGRLLARQGVAAALGCEPGAVRLEARCRLCGGAHGKPRVHDAAGGALDLSIAHAHERVIVAVAGGCAVGVDVERIGPFEDLAREAAGVLDGEERAVLSALAPAERAVGFFRYWTRKEALLKATGHGLAIEPASLRVTPPDRDAGLICAPPALVRGRVWMSDLDAGPGYAACLALLIAPGSASDDAVPHVDHVRVCARELAQAAHSSA